MFFHRDQDRSYLSDLKKTVYRSGLKSALLSIAWTAGPVTLMAIVLGYYIAYGGLVPITNILYFSIYALVVGLSGYTTKIIIDAKRLRKEQASQAMFLEVVEQGYQVLKNAQQLKLASLTNEEQLRRIAESLLEKSHPSSEEVYYALEILCDENIAKYTQTVQMYLNNGIDPKLLHRHFDIEQMRHQVLNQALPERLQALVLQKIEGGEVSVNDGVDRSPGFLTKILNSGGQLNLFDLDDACEMVKLSLELLSGRNFYYFKAITNFDNLKQDKLFTQMEYLRQRMRLKQWQAHGLVEQIYQTLSQPSPDMDIRALVQVEKDLSYNFTQMYQAVKDASLGFYSAEINKQVTQLAQGFRSVRDGINRDLKRYRYALNLWNSSAFTTRDMFEEAVQVKMDSVQLEESERYDFAEKLSIFYQHQTLTDAQQIKRFAICIVKQLTTLIDLESPSIACAIEVSQGANLSSVGYNYSTQLKVEMTHNLAKSVYANIRMLKRRYRLALSSQYEA